MAKFINQSEFFTKQGQPSNDRKLIGALCTCHRRKLFDVNTPKGKILSDFARLYLDNGKLTPAQLITIRTMIAPIAKANFFDIGNAPADTEISTETGLELVLSDDKQMAATIPLKASKTPVAKRGRAALKKLDAVYDKKKDQYKIPFCRFNAWALSNAGFTFQGKLKEHMAKPAPVKQSEKPQGIKGDPFPYQLEAVWRLHKLGGNALLADEQGLGKTAEYIMWAAKETPKRVLVICPASAKYNWEKEILSWLPDSRVFVCEGFPDHSEIVGLHKYNWLICNPTILKAVTKDKVEKGWLKAFLGIGFDALVIDEGHFLVNEKTLQTEACTELSDHAESVTIATGTPTDRKVIKLFQLVKFIDGGTLFPSKMKFGERYCQMKKAKWHKGFDYDGAENLEELHRILTDTIMIRRTKEEVQSQLPSKRRSVITVKMMDAFVDEYQQAENNFRDWLISMKGKITKGQATAEAMIKVNYLKQIAGKSKINMAIDWIENYLENENKLVVFAIHKEVIQALKKRFGKSAVVVDGSVSGKARQEAVDTFQNNPKVNLFIGQLAASATAITLTAAKDTLTIELDWQAIKHAQAEDRVHRIGQTRSVNAYYMVTRNTIEERLMSLLDENLKVMGKVIDGKEVTSADDLGKLFNEYMKVKK